LLEKSKNWDEFNQFSIGIELVNNNGNVFDYTEEQMQSLYAVITHLKSSYPALSSPYRIVGHEQIAGWRGKCDPGHKFDWGRLYRELYPEMEPPIRQAILPKALANQLQELADILPPDCPAAVWEKLSSFLETTVAELQK